MAGMTSAAEADAKPVVGEDGRYTRQGQLMGGYAPTEYKGNTIINHKTGMISLNQPAIAGAKLAQGLPAAIEDASGGITPIPQSAYMEGRGPQGQVPQPTSQMPMQVVPQQRQLPNPNMIPSGNPLDPNLGKSRMPNPFPAGKGYIQPNTQAQYDMLAPGTMYLGSDGQVRMKGQ